MGHKNFALAAVLLLVLVNEGYSLKCYSCSGDMKSDCAKKPKQGLALNCSSTTFSLPSRDNLIIDVWASGNATNSTNATHACMTTKHKINSKKMVTRQCTSRAMDCNYVRNHTSKNVTIDSCKTCYTDLCNSASSSVNVGVLALAMYACVTLFSQRSSVFS